MLKSKSVWTGAVMVALGLLKMAFPDVSSAVEGDPTTLVGTGAGIVFLRLGIAKNGFSK